MTLQELSRMASRILLACAALQFPQYRVRPTMLQFIELLRRSTSWRVRLDVLLPLQGEYSFSTSRDPVYGS